MKVIAGSPKSTPGYTTLFDFAEAADEAKEGDTRRALKRSLLLDVLQLDLKDAPLNAVQATLEGVTFEYNKFLLK